jgi:hypothetical protein
MDAFGDGLPAFRARFRFGPGLFFGFEALRESFPGCCFAITEP